jgi:WD40 repeat protein
LLDNGNIAYTTQYKNVPCITIIDSSNDLNYVTHFHGRGNQITDYVYLTNNRFASISQGIITFWDIDNKSSKSMVGHDKSVMCLSFIKKNRLLISGCEDHIIKLWNVDNYGLINTIMLHDATIRSFLTLCGGYIASASGDNKIKIWNIKDGKCVNTLEGHKKYAYIKSLYLLNDNRIVSISTDNTLILWGF